MPLNYLNEKNRRLLFNSLPVQYTRSEKQLQVFGGISELPELMESSDFQNLVIPNGSRTPASADIHKSVRVEISRGIRVIPSLLEREVSRKGAKKSNFLCVFA